MVEVDISDPRENLDLPVPLENSDSVFALGNDIAPVYLAQNGHKSKTLVQLSNKGMQCLGRKRVSMIPFRL